MLLVSARYRADYATAQEIGAHGFICTSTKTGCGTLEAADEGPASYGEPDTMSGQGEQYLGAGAGAGAGVAPNLIMKFAQRIGNGQDIPKLVTFLSLCDPIISVAGSLACKSLRHGSARWRLCLVLALMAARPT